MGVRAVFNGTRYVWTPAVRTISPGTTVRWRAVNGGHNIKSRGANWSYFHLASGTTRTRTFNRRGTFRYYCTIRQRRERRLLGDVRPDRRQLTPRDSSSLTVARASAAETALPFASNSASASRAASAASAGRPATRSTSPGRSARRPAS